MPGEIIKIKMIDPVYCKVVDKKDRQLVWDILQYEEIRHVQKAFGSEKALEVRSSLDKRSGNFLTGFLPRVERVLRNRGYDPVVDDTMDDWWQDTVKPYLPGMEPRQDQVDLLDKVRRYQRGYIKSPTGSGKTVIAGFIHSMFPGARTLFLCHTIDLLTQSADEFQKWGFNVISIGGGKKEFNEPLSGDIFVATIQTFSKLPDINQYCDYFDVIIVDECHHITKPDGMYANILDQSYAPVRIGLTATDENVNRFLEGYIGPKIGEFTIQDGIESGVLAEPEVHWINTPIDDETMMLKKYSDIYDRGIVNNRARNRLVILEAKKEIEQGRSVLTFVQFVEHGKNLMAMAKLLDVETVFVWGATERETRKRVKEALEEKKILHVIASCVWNEGINIRSLDVVNNAAGGKKEVRTIQKIGRGLRTTDMKKTVILKDYLDVCKYLSHHAMMRMRVYVEFGWKMKGV